MLLAERMNKVRMYVSKSFIDDVMFKIGEAGMMHQTDIRESLKDLEGLSLIHISEPTRPY